MAGPAPLLLATSPDARATALAWTPIGRSRQGRPIHAMTIPGWDPGGPRVLLIAGIHGDEGEGLAVLDRLIDDLRDRAAQGRTDSTVRVIRDMNPDGTSARTRTNAAGVDLNRNWPAANFSPARARGRTALSEPEADTVAAEIARFRPTLLIVLHSSGSGPFVNYDGPAAELAAAFAAAAARRDPGWRVVREMGYPTPGSLGSWIGDDQRIPILTIECRRGQNAQSLWEPLRDGVRAVVR